MRGPSQATGAALRISDARVRATCGRIGAVLPPDPADVLPAPLGLLEALERAAAERKPGRGYATTEYGVGLRKAVQEGRRELEMAYPPMDLPPPPKTRGECAGGPRPCVFYRCHYHLGLDVKSHLRGLAIYIQPDNLAEAPATCALDVADLGGITLEMVAAATGLTRERIRQIEGKALLEVRRMLLLEELVENVTARLARDASRRTPPKA